MKTKTRMTLGQHFAELRRRILWTFVVFVIAPVAGGECAGEFVDKAEFPQFGDLRPFVLFHASDRILHKSSENFAVSQLRSPRSVRRSRSAVIPREDRTSVQRPCRRFSEGKGRRRTVRRGRDIIIFKELCRFRENRLFLPL